MTTARVFLVAVADLSGITGFYTWLRFPCWRWQARRNVSRVR